MALRFSDTTYFVKTFGCQMNKHDSERVSGMLDALGCSAVGSLEDADIVVYMTCCVREAADERLYGQIMSMKNVPLREGTPLSKRIVAVGGCIGQRDGESLIEKMPHIDIVFGTHNLASLPALIGRAISEHAHVSEVLEASIDFPTSLPSTREHAWSAWLPITIGCDNFCTYCIVPYVRGREKSRTMDDILEEAESLKSQGVLEVTLLGQNVNSYGRDLYGEPRFAELLAEIDRLGFARLRFATSHPKYILDEVIADFGKLKTLQPALHLPVQSGSNRILELMNRRYTREYYLGLIEKLRKACPDIALSTDIIVGFPGETEEDFQQTYELVKEVGYHQVFSFLYSKRTGTPAAGMPDDTPREVIQERFDRLLKVVEENAYELNQLEDGKIVPVLFEGVSKKDEAMITGHTPKNQTVHVPLPDGIDAGSIIGSILDVRITEARTWYLKGELLGSR